MMYRGYVVLGGGCGEAIEIYDNNNALLSVLPREGRYVFSEEDYALINQVINSIEALTVREAA